MPRLTDIASCTDARLEMDYSVPGDRRTRLMSLSPWVNGAGYDVALTNSLGVQHMSLQEEDLEILMLLREAHLEGLTTSRKRAAHVKRRRASR